MRRWRGRLVLATVVLAIAAGVVALRVVTAKTPPDAASHAERAVRIPVGAGVSLAATVFQPAHPAGRLIVMPASWGSGPDEYADLARRLTGDGDLVVTYGQRGFGGSGGSVDLAGPATVGDVGRVVDWALARPGAAQDRVGVLGVSYGGGVALLAAGRDPRIKAVVALSAWTDLAAALAPGGTPNTAALTYLLDGATATPRLGPGPASLRAASGDPARLAERIRDLAPARSAQHVIAALDRNRPAVFLGSGYQDSVFDPADLLRFVSDYRGPRELELSSGDHGGPEYDTLHGGRSAEVDDAVAWLGDALGSTAPPATERIVARDARTGAAHVLPAWPSHATVNPLGAPWSAAEFGPDITRSWRARLAEGAMSAADSGASAFDSSDVYSPPHVAMSSLTAASSLVWTAPAGTSRVLVCGTPTLSLDLAAASPASVFGYLYDVAPDGTGTLMSSGPVTVPGDGDHDARRAVVQMYPICWTVPVGDHLAVVVDAADARYASPGTGEVVISTSRRHPATFAVPANTLHD